MLIKVLDIISIQTNSPKNSTEDVVIIRNITWGDTLEI